MPTVTTTIAKVECWVLRAPIVVPVANAFGAMHNRPAVFLRVSASDGAWGWGEVVGYWFGAGDSLARVK